MGGTAFGGKGFAVKIKSTGNGSKGGIFVVDVMCGRWSDDWGSDEWLTPNYRAEARTGYLRSLATLAPAKPVIIQNRYDPIDDAADKSYVVPIADFIKESTWKTRKNNKRKTKFAGRCDCSREGRLPNPRAESSGADSRAAGGSIPRCSLATPHDTEGLADIVSVAGRRAPRAVDRDR